MTDPTALTVVDDRLYLNYSETVRSQWVSDIPWLSPQGIRKLAGDQEWPSPNSVDTWLRHCRSRFILGRGVKDPARKGWVLYFIACFTFVGFIVVHVVEVILTGFFKNIRSMVTGWFVNKHEGKKLPASFSHRSGPQRTPVSTPPGLHSLRPC